MGQSAALAAVSLIVGLIKMVLVMLETVPKLVCMLCNAAGMHVQLVLLTPSSSRARGAQRQVGQLVAPASPSLIVGLIQMVLAML